MSNWYSVSYIGLLFLGVCAVGYAQLANGRWEGPYHTPLIAVAAANLPDGKIVYWSAYDRFWYFRTIGQTYTGLFDPNTKTTIEALVQNTNHDMFCPGTAVLADTRILITGGSTAESTTIFDPRVGAQGSWTEGPDMNIPRGYHSMTMLTDGDVFTLGGSW